MMKGVRGAHLLLLSIICFSLVAPLYASFCGSDPDKSFDVAEVNLYFIYETIIGIISNGI
jgi:hypothetical protein